MDETAIKPFPKQFSPVAKHGYLRRFAAWEGCLVVTSFIGVAAGFGLGFMLYSLKASPTTMVWIGLPGELFMRMMKAAILPLIISTIISGSAGLKPKENGKVSVVSLTYILTTNILGAVLGTVLALIIQPGKSEVTATENTKTVDMGNLKTSDLFADLIRNMVPDNLVSACFQKSQTHYREVEGGEDGGSNVTVFVQYLGTASGTNILGLVIACAAIGMASSLVETSAKPFQEFFAACAEVVMALVQRLVLFTPIGVASLIAVAIGRTSNVERAFRGLGLFVLAEVVGNLIFVLVVYPLIYFVVVRQNPLVNPIRGARAAMAAVGPPSAAMAMPEILTAVETHYGVDKRVSRFVVPLAAAINRDGSVMFIAVTSIYMAQVQGDTAVDTILLIAVLAAVGSLAIPSVANSSIVTVLMILASLNIPPANIGIVLALEWFSDRIRTVVNAYSHILCSVVTWHLCKKDLLADLLVVDAEAEDKEATSNDEMLISEEKV